MIYPQAVLNQAATGQAPATWRVFTKRRGPVRGFFQGTSGDPDPLLVVTPDGVVEYFDNRRPATVVEFGHLASVRLRVAGTSSVNSPVVQLRVWLDLGYPDGRTAKWRAASFGDKYETVQAFIEAFGVYQSRVRG